MLVFSSYETLWPVLDGSNLFFFSHLNLFLTIFFSILSLSYVGGKKSNLCGIIVCYGQDSRVCTIFLVVKVKVVLQLWENHCYLLNFKKGKRHMIYYNSRAVREVGGSVIVWELPEGHYFDSHSKNAILVTLWYPDGLLIDMRKLTSSLLLSLVVRALGQLQNTTVRAVRVLFPASLDKIHKGIIPSPLAKSILSNS